MKIILILIVLLLAGSGAAAQDLGFDFRQTSGYVTDPTYAAPVLGETYPHTYTNGTTSMVGGFETNGTTCFQGVITGNLSTTVDARLAGVNSNNGNASSDRFQCVFRVDLPSTGNWTVSLAGGYAGASNQNISMSLNDNGTSFFSKSNFPIGVALFFDANGIVWSAANWPSSNSPFVHQFTSTTFEVVLGPNSSGGSFSSTIAHLRLVKGGNVRIDVAPNTPVLRAGQTQTFTATQVGSPVAGGVTWSCPGCVGSVNSSTGVYTAPSPIAVNQSHAGCQIGPNDSIFNTRIDSLPVDSHSASWISSASLNTMLYEYFTPFNFDDGTTPSQTMTFFYTPLNNGSFVIPVYPNAKRETGWLAAPFVADHHLEVVNRNTCDLQEMYNLYTPGTNPSCPLCTSASGWKYNGMSYALPVNGATDAGSLPLMPLSIHLAEMQKALATGGTIKHAVRLTMNSGAIGNNNIWPAMAFSSGSGPIPYGARARLKSTFNISSFSPIAQILLTQMKQYGMMLADIGTGWAMSIDADAWPPEYTTAFKEIRNAFIAKSNIEFVDETGIQTALPGGATSSATTTGEHVVATSVSVPANSASMGVALNGVTIGMDAPVIWFQAGAAPLQLKAYVNGSATTTATWSMSPTLGTLTSGGLYTPPSTSGTLQTSTVTATAVADGSTSTTMLLNVLPGGVIRIVPGQPSNYTDTQGHVWFAVGGDTTGGHPFDDMGTFPSVPDITLYKIPYYTNVGDLEYDFYVPNGNYNVTGKFAETNVPAGVDSVSLETQGVVIYPNVDMYVAAGGNNLPVDFTLPASVTNGKLSFILRDLTGFNFINALQIAPAGSSHSAGVKISGGTKIQ